jgi:hypothetical protein
MEEGVAENVFSQNKKGRVRMSITGFVCVFFDRNGNSGV